MKMAAARREPGRLSPRVRGRHRTTQSDRVHPRVYGGAMFPSKDESRSTSTVQKFFAHSIRSSSPRGASQLTARSTIWPGLDKPLSSRMIDDILCATSAGDVECSRAENRASVARFLPAARLSASAGCPAAKERIQAAAIAAAATHSSVSDPIPTARLAQFFSANVTHRPRIALDRGPAGMQDFDIFQSCADSGPDREIGPGFYSHCGGLWPRAENRGAMSPRHSCPQIPPEKSERVFQRPVLEGARWRLHPVVRG